MNNKIVQVKAAGLIEFRMFPASEGIIIPPTVPKVMIMLPALSKLFVKNLGMKESRSGYKPPKLRPMKINDNSEGR